MEPANQDHEMDSDEIVIILKPMNITEIHKREVKISVQRYQKVEELAKTLVTILGIKGF